MVAHRHKPGLPHPISARFYLWTIRKQDQITRGVVMNIWAAVSAILACAVVGLVSLQMTLQIMIFGGTALGSLMWVLIERRRSWLLGISEPKLRAEAHQVMIDYLNKRLRCRPGGRKKLTGCDASPIA